MDYTEFRLLALMLQLRGQFGKEGALMVNSGIQVFEEELVPLMTVEEPVVINNIDMKAPEPVVETADASQYVTETMLNIIVEREKTYLKNAQKLYGMLNGDNYQKGHYSGYKH